MYKFWISTNFREKSLKLKRDRWLVENDLDIKICTYICATKVMKIVQIAFSINLLKMWRKFEEKMIILNKFILLEMYYYFALVD